MLIVSGPAFVAWMVADKDEAYDGADEATPRTHAPSRMDRSRIDSGHPPLGNVTRRSASRHIEWPAASQHAGWTTAIRYPKPPVGNVASADDRHFLHRRDDGDVLQRARRPEHKRLRISGRVRFRRRVRSRYRVCIRQRVGSKRQRRRQHVVHPAVHARTGGERTVQLTGKAREILDRDRFEWSRPRGQGIVPEAQVSDCCGTIAGGTRMDHAQRRKAAMPSSSHVQVAS